MHRLPQTGPGPYRRPVVLAAALAATLFTGLAACGGSDDSAGTSTVAVAFSTSAPDGAPFPSDRYTVADANQLSTRRVALPKPDCAVQVSDCQDIDELNTLDGFSLTPRFTLPFTGDIDPASVSSDSVYLVRVGGPDGWRLAERSGINQIAWDPDSRTLSCRCSTSPSSPAWPSTARPAPRRRSATAT